VTVTYGKRKRQGESAQGEGSRRHPKKKKRTYELKNFYAHQMREEKREQLARLRKKFEEDKARIERMKSARKFKPFG
jgi:ribosomal RNA-processing protein 7